MGNLINVPYVKQPKNSAKCGAACASMVIKHYLGTRVTIDEVWENISAISPELNREYCKTHKIGAYLSSKNLRSCTVRYTSLKGFLEFCNNHGIASIINHKSFENNIAGHFSVVKNINENIVIINDPENKNRKSVALSQLELMATKSGQADEVGGNTAIVPSLYFEYKPSPCGACGADIDISFSVAANQKTKLVEENLCQTCDSFNLAQ